MKFLTKLSTIFTVAIATTTFANAQTTEVTTSEVVKVPTINAVELINNVELNLLQSMKEIKVTLANDSINEQKTLISQAKVNRKNNGQLAKLTLAAE